AFRVAKKIRTQTNINRLPSSVGSAGVALAQQIFGDLSDRRILVIGSGKMSRICLKHLREEGASDITVANRTLHKAEELAGKFNGRAIPLDDIQDPLQKSDIILTSTGSDSPVVQQSDLENIFRARGSRPLFFIDIAVPRDVDEEVRHLDNVYLYNIDDLESVVEQNISHRESELEKAEDIVEDGVNQFEEWLKTQDMGPMIEELKQEVYQLVEKELRKQLSPESHSVKKRDLQLAAHRITNKLLDDPLNNMKEKAIEGDLDALKAVQDVFDLEEPIEKGA
ncbi:MAG: glutamyl-tRNA reductase, partial [bacterium]